MSPVSLTWFRARTVTPYTVKGLRLLMVRLLSCDPTAYSENEEAEWGIFFSVGKLLLNSRVKVLKCLCYSINCLYYSIYIYVFYILSSPSPIGLWIFYFFGFGIGIESRGTGFGTRA